jgi:peptidoglycan/xylan/chitin deacetylase (PgdA/CDA1 family)
VARARALVRRTVKVASAGVDRLRPNVAGVVILIYHRVGGGSSLEIDLDPGLFDQQMAAVAASNRVLSLGAALARLDAPADRRPDVDWPDGDWPDGDLGDDAGSVVITFDDGTADFVDVALPILERHGVCATLYAATSFIEEGVDFPDHGRPLSWAALRDACATGLVDVGSHTHHHRLLDRVSPAEAADELDRSGGLIAERLGRPALDFAYPKAVAGTPEVAQLVRDRFRSAALAGTRVNPYRSKQPPRATDPQSLARSPIQVSDGMRFFERKLAGGMALEDSLRRVVNRARYARAST